MRPPAPARLAVGARIVDEIHRSQRRTDVGIRLSYSRPRVSNDNPYSEALFKTVKYDLQFPSRFESIEHARAHLDGFFSDYNEHHRHSGLNYYTPNDVHHARPTLPAPNARPTWTSATRTTLNASAQGPSRTESPNEPASTTNKPARCHKQLDSFRGGVVVAFVQRQPGKP
jgi:hypothetical protein